MEKTSESLLALTCSETAPFILTRVVSLFLISLGSQQVLSCRSGLLDKVSVIRSCFKVWYSGDNLKNHRSNYIAGRMEGDFSPKHSKVV